jgi:hypothetical protein
MVNNGSNSKGMSAATGFDLTIDGRTYRVEVLRRPDGQRPGVISVDGNVYNVERTEDGVKVDDESFVASLCADFGIVNGKLYETEWKTR